MRGQATHPVILPLSAGYDLFQPFDDAVFTLRRRGAPLQSSSRFNTEGWRTLQATDAPELRAFAADMVAAAEGDDYRPIDVGTPRDGSGFLGFGRHDIDNGPHWRIGDFWWGIILWDVWRACEPRWVFSKDGQPVWSEPTHWAPLKPPGAVLAEVLGAGVPA